MGCFLPPTPEPEKLKREIALVPKAIREDAIQEAWVAHLEGRDPIQATNTYTKRDRAFRTRHVQIDYSEHGEPVAVDKDGTTYPI